jgi:hypothetical protein
MAKLQDHALGSFIVYIEAANKYLIEIFCLTFEVLAHMMYIFELVLLSSRTL